MPSIQDIQAPFDPTAYVSITGAQLLQLINGSAPYTNKGMVITTTDDVYGNPDTPDAGANTKWQSYIWRRISNTGSVSLFVWNPALSSRVPMLQWQSIVTNAFPAGSVGTNQLINGSVTDDKMASCSWTKLINIPQATTDLTGVYPNLSLGTLNVGNSQVKANSISPAEKLSAADTTGVKYNALTVPRVNAAQTAFEMVNPGVLQVVETDDSTQLPLTSYLTDFITALNWSSGTGSGTGAAPLAGGVGVEYTSIATSITPKSASSLLFIDIDLICPNNGVGVIAALFKNPSGSDAAIAVGGGGVGSSGGYTSCAHFKFKVAAGSTSAITFKLKLWMDGNGHMTINRYYGSASPQFGGLFFSSMRITEVLQ